MKKEIDLIDEEGKTVIPEMEIIKPTNSSYSLCCCMYTAHLYSVICLITQSVVSTQYRISLFLLQILSVFHRIS